MHSNEIITLCSDNYTKHISILCVKYGVYMYIYTHTHTHTHTHTQQSLCFDHNVDHTASFHLRICGNPGLAISCT